MLKKSVVRRLLVTALIVAVLAPAAPLLADGSEEAGAPDTTNQASGLLEEVLDWLLGVVDPAETDPNDGETGPSVDPSG